MPLRPILLTVLLAAASAHAEGVDCAALAERAAAAEGIPPGLMTAIAKTESGRRDRQGNLSPWPWTLNQGGRGSFHETRAAALEHLRELLEEGVTNVDIGCMQINYRWHHAGFASVEAMMDPVGNTRYAARFLRALHDDLGSWDGATAAYHSMDARKGADYLTRVTSLRHRGLQPPDTPAEGAAEVSAVALRVVGLLALPPQPLVNLRAAQSDDGKPGLPARRADLPPLTVPVPQGPLLDAQSAPMGLRRNWSEVALFRDQLSTVPAVPSGSPERP